MKLLLLSILVIIIAGQSCKQPEPAPLKLPVDSVGVAKLGDSLAFFRVVSTSTGIFDGKNRVEYKWWDSEYNPDSSEYYEYKIIYDSGTVKPIACVLFYRDIRTKKMVMFERKELVSKY